MALLSSFEVLAENLVPQGILPPQAPNPFVVQGYWVQVSLVPGVQSANFNLIFQETTDFKQGGGQQALAAQIIDATGNANLYGGFFASTGRGFLGQQINFGQTLIYGVQAFPTQTLEGKVIPQSGTGWRGTVQISGQNPGTLIATPTQRLVYYPSSDITKGPVVDAVVYSVPTFSGGTQI